MSMFTRLVVVVASVVGVLALAGPAIAGSANMGTDSSGAVYVEYKANQGDKNTLSVSSCGTSCVSFADAGVSIAAGWGWFQDYGCINPELVGVPIGVGVAGPFTANCSHRMRPIDYLVIDLADGDDTLTIGSSLPSSIITFVDGGTGDDALSGGPTIDNLYGNVGNDRLVGGTNCDNLGGQDGNDLLDGGLAGDNLNGGNGSDIADYSGRTFPLFVSLDLHRSGNLGPCNGSPLGNDGEFGEGDNVSTNIETVLGGQQNDALFGNGAANVLVGNLGDDRLDGGLGADDLIGGGGIDTADYMGRTISVSVTLDGLANDGQPGEFDRVAQIENVGGGSGDDQLTGDAGSNRLSGGGGRDTLDGGLGSDTLLGDDQADLIRAVDGGMDTVDCGADVDTAFADAFATRPGSMPAPIDAVAACETMNWAHVMPSWP
jgi:Ca2+-binding RTX toxin-like protein